MLRYRKILLVLAIVIVLGSLSGTLAYALHLRSDSYRRGVEARLSRRLGMRVSVGSIEPLSLRSRRFNNIRLFQSRRRVQVFRCDQAVWQDASQDSVVSYTLDLDRGWLLAGSGEWNRADYDQMLRSGLGHDFSALHIREVHLHDIDLRWTHPSFSLAANKCRGEIRFDDNGTGRASLISTQLNGEQTSEPINIVAYFTPGRRLRFHKVVVKFPEVSLGSLKLEGLLGVLVTQGRFAGHISYRDRGKQQSVTLGGQVQDALLGELTGAIPGGPYNGQVDMLLDEATFDNGVLTRLEFGGRLGHLRLEQLAPVFGIGGLSGRIDLRIHRCSYRREQIEYLSAEGGVTGVSLSRLTKLIGRGRITGTLTVTIDSLLVVDGQLVLANVTLEALPPDDGPGLIDREVLKTASEQLLGFDATTLLPTGITHIEYAHLGVRLDVNRGLLRIHGTHGDDGRTILTVKLFGREFGIITEPKRAYKIEPFVESVRERIDRYDTNRLLDWWRSRRSLPTRGDRDDRSD